MRVMCLLFYAALFRNCQKKLSQECVLGGVVVREGRGVPFGVQTCKEWDLSRLRNLWNWGSCSPLKRLETCALKSPAGRSLCRSRSAAGRGRGVGGVGVGWGVSSFLFLFHNNFIEISFTCHQIHAFQ